MKESFKMGFAVREKEKEALLQSKLPAKMKGELIVAKKFPEGYPIRLTIKKKNDMKTVHLIIQTLQLLRK